MRELIEPMEFFGPSERTDGLIEPMLPLQKVTPLDFLMEQAKVNSKKMCEVDLTVGIVSGQIETNPLPPESHSFQIISQPQLPQLPKQETEPPQYNLTCDVEAKVTPYTTARKLMKQVSLLSVDSCLYIYNGTYYQRLTPVEAQRLIVDKCRKDVELAGTPGHPRAVYDFLLMEPELTRQGLNINRRVVSFLNGVLVLDTGELRPHSPAWVTTYCLQCCYLGGNSVSPRFDQFLMQITGGDVTLAERVWQMIGYILIPDTNGKVFFLLQGVPNSGKSVLSALLSSFFNEEAVSALDVHALSEKFAVSELQGKALCLSPDLPSGSLDNKAVSKLKQLTGNDVVSADVKYKDRVQFLCMAKLVLASNHLLFTRERDDAFIERVVVIPFNYATPKEHQDPYLLECLKMERDAIATKAIAAYFRLVSQKYRFSGNYILNRSAALCMQDSDAGVDLTSSIYNFLRLCFVPDKEAGVFTEDAHSLFVEKYGVVSINAFSNQFSDLAYQLYGAEKTRRRKNPKGNALSYITGIRLSIKEGI